MKKTKIIFLAIISVLFLISCTAKENFGPYGSTHIHADFQAYTLGKPLDFNLPRYQVMEDLTHVERNDGEVIHIHATGITLGYFFKSLGYELTDECFALDTGNKYCNLGKATLKVYLKNRGSDWEQIYYPSDYVIQDLDKMLVTYGPEDNNQIKEQQATVTDKSRFE